ncbi:MAG: AzlD domain-containing protein [Deltaproteobacteria bacterium]|nr:AzlD domain-containing protein [Candidatus Anaeroferrophillacea bacterium]
METDAAAVWLMIVLGGVVTFLIRFVPLQLMGRNLNDRTREIMSFVPPAVLSALVANSLFDHGIRSLSPHNQKLWAALAALLVGLRFKNVIVTIVTGMVCLWLLNFLLTA